MNKQRRELNVFSLSFLDAICCGFGAIIILFVLSKGGESLRIEPGPVEDPSATLAELQGQIRDVRVGERGSCRNVTIQAETAVERDGEISQTARRFFES